MLVHSYCILSPMQFIEKVELSYVPHQDLQYLIFMRIFRKLIFHITYLSKIISLLQRILVVQLAILLMLELPRMSNKLWLEITNLHLSSTPSTQIEAVHKIVANAYTNFKLHVYITFFFFPSIMWVENLRYIKFYNQIIISQKNGILKTLEFTS